MKIHILSDVHIEHGAFTPPETQADVVLLAGDIGTGVGGVRWAQRAFPRQQVLYVPGNHEFYGADINATHRDMKAAAKGSNVLLLDRQEVILGGVRFIGATLWTDFEVAGAPYRDMAMHACRNGMADYSVIFKDARTLRPADTLSAHERDRDWLENHLRVPFAGPTVVITHHAPHPCSIAERFRHDLLTAGFVSDLTALMGFQGLWVHGHTHDPFDYALGDTRVICNPRGYPREHCPEGKVFSPGLVVEL